MLRREREEKLAFIGRQIAYLVNNNDYTLLAALKTVRDNTPEGFQSCIDELENSLSGKSEPPSFFLSAVSEIIRKTRPDPDQYAKLISYFFKSDYEVKKIYHNIFVEIRDATMYLWVMMLFLAGTILIFHLGILPTFKSIYAENGGSPGELAVFMTDYGIYIGGSLSLIFLAVLSAITAAIINAGKYYTLQKVIPKKPFHFFISNLVFFLNNDVVLRLLRCYIITSNTPEQGLQQLKSLKRFHNDKGWYSEWMSGYDYAKVFASAYIGGIDVELDYLLDQSQIKIDKAMQVLKNQISFFIKLYIIFFVSLLAFTFYAYILKFASIF